MIVRAKGTMKAIFKAIVDSQARSNGNIESVGRSYYPSVPTCQIPNLNLIFEQYFGRRRDGLFVEFGAFDGEYASNSCALADTGWKGFFLEPVPEYYELCRRRHARNINVTVSQYAIGAERGKLELYVGGVLSTANKEIKENFERLEWAKGIVTEKTIIAEMLTLEEYLTQNKIHPHFEVLSVDVEGYEWNVFRNFNISKWHPRMVIIELHDQNNDYLCIRDDCNKLVEYFDRNNYKVIYKDLSNTVYVPKDEYPMMIL